MCVVCVLLSMRISVGDGSGTQRRPWIVVTKKGERFAAVERPLIKGDKVVFTLAESGTLISYPASLIDWSASEAASRGEATPTAAVVMVTPTRPSALRENRTLVEAARTARAEGATPAAPVKIEIAGPSTRSVKRHV